MLLEQCRSRHCKPVDLPDIIENVLKCKHGKDGHGEKRYDAFVSLNSTDPALIEAREIIDIPVL